MKYEIKNRFDNACVVWSGEIEDQGSEAKNLGEAVKKAIAGKSDLEFANLRSANLRFANLESANLESADLRSANLEFANLESADLRFANLESANLESADLQFADLESADLRSANLEFANLRSANLRFANLESANLESADLQFANLRSANLRFAHISKQKIARILQIGPIGSRGGFLVVWVMESGDFRYSTGCQTQITEEAFRDRVVATHGGNEHGRAYMEAIEFAHRIANVYAPKKEEVSE